MTPLAFLSPFSYISSMAAQVIRTNTHINSSEALIASLTNSLRSSFALEGILISEQELQILVEKEVKGLETSL